MNGLDQRPRVEVHTELGHFVVVVEQDKAPLTAGRFLDYVEGGHLDGGSVYRIVTPENEERIPAHPIRVVQWGWVPPAQEPLSSLPPLPPVAHEPTGHTGLRHRDGTLSAARLEPGTAGSAYFICIGEHPCLDEGGQRHADGQGFAAFGHVEEGREVVQAILGRAEARELLAAPIAIFRVVRRSAPPQR